MTPDQSVQRTEALMHFYAAERRAGATPIEANERLHEYAKRIDALFDEKQRYAAQEAMEDN